jgi:glucose-1-phosphate thymidylyltransferase
MNDFVGVIPAAGQGTRLGLPFPKELWPLPRQAQYIPVANRSVELFLAAGIKQIIIVISANKLGIMQHFGDGSRFGAEFIYACQEPHSKNGKGPDLSQALDCAYPISKNRRVAFLMPDTYIYPTRSLSQLISGAGKADLALGLFPTDRPHKFGMVKVENRKVIEIIDKPAQTDLRLMWGMVVWSPRFSDHLRACMKNDSPDFASVMNRAIQKNLDVQAVEVLKGKYMDFGTYDELCMADSFIDSLEEEKL